MKVILVPKSGILWELHEYLVSMKHWWHFVNPVKALTGYAGFFFHFTLYSQFVLSGFFWQGCLHKRSTQVSAVPNPRSWPCPAQAKSPCTLKSSRPGGKASTATSKTWASGMWKSNDKTEPAYWTVDCVMVNERAQQCPVLGQHHLSIGLPHSRKRYHHTSPILHSSHFQTTEGSPLEFQH